MAEENTNPKSHPWGDDNDADCEEFRKRGYEMVDFIANLYKNIEKQPVTPTIQRGYLSPQLNDKAPEEGVAWETTMADVKSKILPGVQHWQHPRFFAYFPCMMSFPALLGDMLADSFNQPGFTWQACPVASELEVVTLKWLVHAIDLPVKFRQENGGGGSIQPTASEACLVTMVAARKKKLDQLGERGEELRSKLTFYCSEASHFSLQKSCSIIGYTMKEIPTVLEPETGNYIMDISILEQTIKKDKEDGFIPTFVSATYGTTGSGAVDPVPQIGTLCLDNDIWFHIDAAYAGSTFFCPEYRSDAKGIGTANSFNFNLSKWFPGLFNSSILFVDNPKYQVESLNHTAIYLLNEEADKKANIPDFKDYEISLGRKFKSLKIWFAMQSYGLEGIRNIIRRHIKLAQVFEEKVKNDDRFELACNRAFSLVCIRYKGASNEQTYEFCTKVNAIGRFHLVPGDLGGKTMLRIVPCYQYVQEVHILELWEHLNEVANDFFKA